MKRFILAALAAVSLAALALGCASNPVKAGCGASKGQTLETCAFALYGTFAITEQQAAKLLSDPAVPIAAKLAIQKADRAASPVLEAAQGLVAQYEQAAAAGSSAALDTATLNLQQWVTQAQAQMGALLTATQGAKSP